jgi:hypothetical protein
MKVTVNSLFRTTITLFALMLLIGFAGAQTTNGCGTGWNRYLVPDSLPLGVCEFKAACDTHDRCYAKCLQADGVTPSNEPHCKYLACQPGGALAADRATCEKPEYIDSLRDARARRKSCDLSFYDYLRALNNDRWLCRAFASLYRKAVEQFGEGAFAGVAPLGDRLVSPGNETAIREFLEKASEEQLRALVERVQRNELDLTKPLRFDRVQGLVYDQ